MLRTSRHIDLFLKYELYRVMRQNKIGIDNTMVNYDKCIVVSNDETRWRDNERRPPCAVAKEVVVGDFGKLMVEIYLIRSLTYLEMEVIRSQSSGTFSFFRH